MYVVILAGGGGTRLWPLSSAERPKPFLPLLGAETLLQRTVHRLFDGPELTATGLGLGDITVVTDRRYAGLVKEQLQGVRILAEPAGRNTAAAVTLAVEAVERPDEEVMLVLPADHRIADESRFRGVLAAAATGLALGAFGIEDPLVTLGIEVDRPATEYGYLVPDLGRGEDVRGLRAYPLVRFEEKPNQARAAELADQAGVAWNAGIFLWRRRAIRDALERHTALFTLIGSVAHSEMALAAAYEQLRPVSIDHAVMEGAAQAGRVVMGAMDVGWNDLGGWTPLLAALGARAIGRVVPPGEEVALGVDDLLIERRSGTLAVVEGPRASMSTATPTALLVGGAGEDRPIVDALIGRVTAAENPS
jgi:mannose-1-phosphate guanylyltransferase